jgi:hypothetical protein
MTKKITLGNHLVPEILAHLEKLTPLPSTGILAGQALSSAILDLYGNGGGVYNDIDIFVPATEDKLAHLRSDEHLKEEALRLGLPFAQLDDYRMLTLSEGRTVQLAGSEQDGLINYVWCDTTQWELLPGALVYGFDLNGVEVALDLEHRELTWTPAFEHFINNYELEITSLTTPERTLLRYLKKREEMPKLFGQDDLVKRMVATWMASDWVNHGTMALTTKTRALAQRFASKLSDMFELPEDLQAPHMDIREDWPMDRVLEAGIEKFVSDFVDVSGLTRIMPTYWYASQRAQAEDASAFAEDLVQFFADRKDHEEGSWENVIHMNAAVMGAAYASGVRSATHRDTILRVLEKHENLHGALQGLTLNEQYLCVLDLAKRAKTGIGQLVYGYVETMATPVDMWNQQHRDQFFRQLAREQKGITLCQPVFSTYEKDGWTIRELVTPSGLRTEGIVMQHCVGGYASKVKRRESRILSIRHAENGKWASTVEIEGKAEAGERISIAQHRSYHNAEPAQQTKDVLQAYLDEQTKAIGCTLKKPKKWGWLPNAA